MSLTRFRGHHLTPFWRSLAERGVTVGILDVPFAPPIGVTRGFEISEWGAHDTLAGRMSVAPSGLAELVTVQTAPHPFSSHHTPPDGPHDVEALKHLSSACLAGVKLRGDLSERLLRESRPQLSLIIFTELHHCAHPLWHTVAPGHHLYDHNAFRNLEVVEPALIDIYREADGQIARLIEAAGDEATVLVFSLHGMRPARGLPTFLEPLLCERGFARRAGWAAQSGRGRALSLAAAIKRRTPPGLKKLYYRTLPQSATYRLAQPTMLPSYDWPRTRAFSLPTDQHGWIRINLVGREAGGCVPLDQYEETCGQIEELLRSLVSERAGAPLVGGVVRTAGRAESAFSLRIPDLIVHWSDAAFASPVRIMGSTIEAFPEAMRLTGQHAPAGFCIFKGPDDLPARESIAARDLHRLITAALLER